MNLLCKLYLTSKPILKKLEINKLPDEYKFSLEALVREIIFIN